MKERIDLLLVERRLTESRAKAQWLIRNGYVLVDGKIIIKPGKKINNSLDILLKKEFPYLGRGGLKLEAALKDFLINVKGKVCLDIGASIGGFTDCLLKQGALKTYAIDTATDILHPSLRCEKMKDIVIPLLGIDARDPINLKENVEICTIDVTFASLRDILPNIKKKMKKNGDLIALIKPLFETDFQGVNKFKIINNPEKLKDILLTFINWSEKNGFYPYGIMQSPLLGGGGSIEFLIHFKLVKNASMFNYRKKVLELLKLI